MSPGSVLIIIWFSNKLKVTSPIPGIVNSKSLMVSQYSSSVGTEVNVVPVKKVSLVDNPKGITETSTPKIAEFNLHPISPIVKLLNPSFNIWSIPYFDWGFIIKFSPPITYVWYDT